MIRSGTPETTTRPKSTSQTNDADSGIKEPNPLGSQIAIVGIGCRYPGHANNVDSFWKLLSDGVDATAPIPEERWNNDRLSSPAPVSESGTIRAERAGIVHDITHFDTGFFGISPREAASMDPQQRIVLEAAYDALEDGGQTLENWRGQDVGVFVGAASTDYCVIQYLSRDGINGHTNSGITLSILANRISYQFDFKGPSLTVDTACSSSLTALDLACRSLSSGDCRLALVGGVNALLLPETSMGFSSATMLAPDGRCKSFDASADGYARGEGAGVVVLKPLKEALEDQDRIYSVIKSTVTNQDGRTSSMTIPNGDAHESMLQRAYDNAGVKPSEMRYIEAHGTGTKVGDPIEVGALASVFSGNGRDVSPCYLGSVKTNIGHLEAGAGIAGLIKASLAVHHGRIPASLNFKVENPDLHLAQHQFEVPTQSLAWPDDGRPRRAGVNSFGFGGANAHVVIEQSPTMEASHEAAPDQQESSNETGARTAHLLTLSARSETALDALAREHLAALRNGEHEIDSYCRAAARRRTHHDHRLAVVGQGRHELINNLAAYLDAPPQTVVEGIAKGVSSRPDSQKDRPVFVFSGMGPQWWGMGRQLFQEEPVFRDCIERCDAALSLHADWSLIDEMMLCDEASSRMSETQVSQPANFALQLGLAALWQSWWGEPVAIVGHSAGEVAAAHLAGMLSFDDAIRVIFHRSRLQHRTSGQGSMLAIGLSADDAQSLMNQVDGGLSIAAINGPQSTTLAGDSAAIDALAATLKDDGVFHRKLSVDVPFHSHYMEPIKDELLDVLSDLTLHKPCIPLYSTVTGGRVADVGYDAAYWWRNVREPVLFAAAIDALTGADHSAFLEISPHPVLSNMVIEGLGRSKLKGTVLASLRRGDAESETLLTSLAQLYVAGHDVDWEAVYQGKNAHLTLPRYPWQRKHSWHEGAEATNNRLLPSHHPLLGTRLHQPEPCWLNDISLHRHAYLADHLVQGSVVFPGVGYVELALAAGRELYDTTQLQLDNLRFERALVLSQDNARIGQIRVSPEHDGISMHSRALGDETSWSPHMHGYIRQKNMESRRRFSIDDLNVRCSEDVTDICYSTFAACGLTYGPSFMGITRLRHGQREALAMLSPLDQLVHTSSVLDSSTPGANTNTDNLHRYMLHPCLLDACLQTLLGTLLNNDTAESLTYLPVSIGRLRLHEMPDAGKSYFVYARQSAHTVDKLEGDLYLLDADGRVLVDVRDLSCQSQKATIEKIDSLYAQDWERQDILQGIDSTWADSVAPRAIEAVIHSDILKQISDHDRERYYTQIDPQLEALTIAAIDETFKALGADWHEGEQLTVESLVSNLSIDPRHDRLVKRFLQALTSRDLLQQLDDHTWVVRFSYEGPAASLISQKIREQFADDLSVLTLLEHCRPSLPEVMRGKTDPVQVMFPTESPSPTEAVYSEGFAIYNVFIEEAVNAVLQQLPKNRQLRILEIGGGSGALASRLRPHLLSGQIHYTFTDVSSAFMNNAKQMFNDVSDIDFRVFNVEKAPASQGFELASFDIVLAGDVLHATKDLKCAVEHATELLVPHGILMLMEMTSPPFTADFIFGQLKGWWAFEDTNLRPDHCCLDPVAWTQLLEQCGQRDVTILSDRPPFDVPAFHSVIMSARPEAISNTDNAIIDNPWLMVMDRDGVGEQLKTEFSEHGQKVIPLVFHEPGNAPNVTNDVTCLPSGDLAALASFISDIENQHTALAGLIYLPAVDMPAFEEADISCLDRASKEYCLDLVNLVKALGSIDADPLPDVALITRDVQQVVDGDQVTGVLGSPIWGLGRVIAQEYPSHNVVLIDLPATPTEQDIAGVHQELVRKGASSEEIALRQGERFVARLNRTDWASIERAQRRPNMLAESDDFYLDVLKPGNLDNFIFRQTPETTLAPHEVEIDVHHASMNFRDLMKVMNIYPDETDRAFFLGDECSGFVRRVGSDVTSVAVGERVAAIAPRFGSVVSTSADLVFPVPDHIDLQGAATIPIVFLTAWYALHQLADVQPGERVLIHAAAGGVGLAAVQIAQRAGAEVFATASSEQKHAHLASMGVKHILNSRTLDFHDEILEATNGEGVDIVLNSLAGEFIPASLQLLRPLGRFVEIGKADIYGKNELNLFPFRKNLSFFAVDLDFMFHHRTALVKRIIEQFMVGFKDKSLLPLPLTSFDINDAKPAFQYMAQVKHIGKIVFDMRLSNSARVIHQAANKKLFSKEASYLLTGGLGGLGLAVAQWMAAEGAGHIILGGRRVRLKDEQRAHIEAITADTGCLITVVKLDITNDGQLTKIVEEHCTKTTPLKGVMHMAMVLDDGYVRDQTGRSFAKAFEPKAKGAWHLHRLTQDKDLDFFVMFSSFAALFGNPGQSNYVAANQFLESLAGHRQARGLPALTISWPAIADAGYVAENDDIRRHLARQGLSAITIAEVLQVLATGIEKQLTTISPVRVNWDDFVDYMPGIRASKRFGYLTSHVVANGDGKSGTEHILAVLETAKPDQRQDILQAWLSKRVVDLLAYDQADFDVTKPLLDLGMDSLMAVQFSSVIEQGTEVFIPPMELTSAMSIARLSTQLLERISIDDDASAKQDVEVPPAVTTEQDNPPVLA